MSKLEEGLPKVNLQKSSSESAKEKRKGSLKSGSVKREEKIEAERGDLEKGKALLVPYQKVCGKDDIRQPSRMLS